MERSSLDDLRLFLAVARHRSFVRAARELGMPTSTLSRRLAAYEAQSSCRLLHRTSRRVALTEDGERLVEQAGPHVEALTRAADEVFSSVPQPRGWVRLTAPVATGAEWVAPAVATLARRYSELRISLRLTNELVDLVESRIDLAVRVGPIRSPGLIARRLRTVPYGLFASPDLVARRLGGRLTLEMAELRELPAVVSAEGASWRLRGGGGSASVRPSARLVVNDPRVALSLAAEGLGVTAAPVEMTTRHGASLVPLTVADHVVAPRELFLVYLARQTPPRVRVVAEWLLRAAKG